MDYFAEIKQLSSSRYMLESEAVAMLQPHLGAYFKAEDKIISRGRIYLEAAVKKKPSLVQNLISQYPLKTQQGYAIMSLAECLDRVPDKKTAYELINDKIGNMSWGSEDGGILKGAVGTALAVASKMGGNAVTYAGLHSAFRLLGKEFIIADDIKDAVKESKDLKKRGYLISYDMLGEGARTDAQAKEYLKSYLEAAENAPEGDSISVKLSALHPRYDLLKYEQLKKELLPRLTEIILAAKARNIAVTIDAEEVARLDLSLLIFAELYGTYDKLGLAVQAYQKNALNVLKLLANLVSQKGVRIPVRLVKGAYWDYEIKKAQTDGLANYPVFTRKELSDLSYLACAAYLLENNEYFYPQFATHNVMSIAAIIEIGDGAEYEFQKLYGMGDEVYDEIIPREKGLKCRVYAPVGEQKDLLAYLIRRLLENGANSSFLNQLTSAKNNFDHLLHLPLRASAADGLKLPSQIFNTRKNSSGFDLGSLHEVEKLKLAIDEVDANINVVRSSEEDCLKAITTASSAFTKWNEREPELRAQILEKIADNFEAHTHELAKLLMLEARRNISDAISEIREAVDFCRYYAAQAREAMRPRKMASITGEDNIYHLEGRGVFLCISPWNFPLAIFSGQILAALVTGNSVVAKPAEQTPKIATLAVKLMHDAGIPKDVLQLVIGSGSKIGKVLTSSPDISGVCFTGSTETARTINKSLAENNPKIIPFIAETGGQNCMIIDSTALIERTVDDMVVSAFGSAGQRCSALRVAYVQDDIAEDLIKTLTGAMAQLDVNFAQEFSTDVSEVIDAKAKENLEKHIKNFTDDGKLITKAPCHNDGDFVAPHLFEIKSISELPGEVFGPVLHIIRYKDLNKVIDEINATGYGLTFGVQTRISSRVDNLAQKIKAGNIYANRSMIGAVVESQAFGGHGLSGTGPKAGGPEYIKRFCVEKVVTNNKTAIGSNLDLL